MTDPCSGSSADLTVVFAPLLHRIMLKFKRMSCFRVSLQKVLYIQLFFLLLLFVLFFLLAPLQLASDVFDSNTCYM